MTNLEEIWKDIKGFKGFYQISNLGNARSLDRMASNHTGRRLFKSRPLRQIKMRHGYPGFCLSKRQKQRAFSIHRLLGIHFIPNPENKPEINHINGIKTDYRLENLEWATRLENMRHAFKTGLCNFSGENSKSAKLTVNQAEEIRSLKGKHTQRVLAKIYGVNHSTIGAVQRNQTWITETVS